MIIRARVPLRISFAGGGTDVSPYTDEYGGAVLNTTISRFATVSLKPRADSKIVVNSIDFDKTVHYDLAEDFSLEGQFALIEGVIKHFKKYYTLPSGFEITIQNDAPPGSGLGSSSAVSVALIGALLEFVGETLTPYEIAELSYKIERIDVGIKGGRQDQYAAAFGGFNFIEFTKDYTLVQPLKLKVETILELEHRLVVAYIGGSHDSSKILSEQIKKAKKGDNLEALHQQKALAYELKKALLLGHFDEMGEILNKAWQVKKSMASGITNKKIDGIYEEAIKAGAIGGKISGAGGGGFMFFLTKPENRYNVMNAIRNMGAQPINYVFYPEGLQIWKIR